MDPSAIFTVEFDKEKFVNNVSDAIKSSEKFEEKMESLSKSADQINFSRPISQLNKFKEELTSAFKAQNSQLGLSRDQINQSVDNIIKSESKIKEFLSAFKKDLQSATDPQEFKTLREAVTLTENALAELTGEELKNETATKSAKARLREMKQELIELEDAGLDDTQMFRQLTIESARLTDQMGDQAEQIRVLSSDTFGLDAGVDLLTQLAAGWQLTEGAMQLFGLSTEETEEQMQKLVAIQSVMNGLQEIHAFLTGQSAAKLALLNGWNKAVALSTALVATVTGEATLATRAFSTALAATGIGAVVVALGLLIANWEEITTAITGATAATDAIEKAQKSATDTLASANKEIELQKGLFEAARKGVISKKQALDDYNKTFGDVLGTAKSYNEAERIFRDKTGAYLAALKTRTIAEALFQESAKKRAEASTLQLNGLDKFRSRFFQLTDSEQKKYQQILKTQGKDAADKYYEGVNEAYVLAQKKKPLIGDANDIEKEATQFLMESLRIEKENQLQLNAEKEKTKKEKNKSQVENIYEELQRGFQSDLEKLNTADLNGLSAINAKAEENYKERIRKINEALQDGKLTRLQAEALRSTVVGIKKTEIQQEVKKFQEERAKALEEADKQQQSLQDELSQNRIDTIRNEYEREIETIKLQEILRLQSIENARKEGIEKINDLVKEEYINQEQAQKRSKNLQQVYDLQIVELKLATNKKLQDVNLRRLESERDLYDKHLETLQSFLTSQQTLEIKAITERFNAGLINEEKLNSQISKIQKKYREQEKQNRIRQINDTIEALQIEIQATEDAKEKETKLKQIYDLQAERNTLETNQRKTPSFLEQIFGNDEQAKKKAEAVQNLVKTTIQSSIDLLKEQSQLEVEAYDRAISLQQGRVDEARKIADAGNAEYLKQETDRLNELEARREGAARRQLEIDQAVQASQILVAVAGAAAQIAQGGTVAVITGIASIIAALGTGITLVNQMKSNAPEFYQGTEYVERGAHPEGRDTIPAMLNIGERIVPTYINKQLKGIKNKDLPKLLTGELFYNPMIQMGEKNLSKEDNTSGLEERLKNLESIQSEQLEYLKTLGINIVMDSEGFAASLETVSLKKKKMFNA
ncbi:hypothetical protein [Chryseobacterium potabilaquae]|uniref:Uncharacterized protein n=1 Tax=Chryseobacterium potabilaquae TaxID=2675057 RepID=A0A6N4X760_9FLAO|nr:hypothetical protein [Chryseobacterium potabilaquae]CAA7196822.1 hypothetical protein CHRY9293_02890 [Chryseobacterium potabilaquae]